MTQPLCRIAIVLAVLTSCVALGTAQSATGDTQITRVAGTIKNAQRDSIAVAMDSGGETSAVLSATTKILRVPPGEKDLKNAVPLTAQELQPGDRVLVRGQASADGRQITALAVIVMKKNDVSARQQRDREDWQKRGVDGLVTAVDTATGAITISSGALSAARKIVVQTSKSTVLRRYAADSVKFEDARPAPLDQIKPGDQLRARGTRNSDGTQLTAEEVVSGTFRNIAGTISAVDPAANTVTVQDVIGKNFVHVRITTDSQMKKLPPEFAQRITMRLKAADSDNGTQASAPMSPGSGGGMRAGAGNGSGGASGAPNFQRLLSRMPSSTLADLQKGDVVMVLSTDGTGNNSVTAITLLAGVEPILAATSGRAASTILSPWSMSSSGGEGEGQP